MTSSISNENYLPESSFLSGAQTNRQTDRQVSFKWEEKETFSAWAWKDISNTCLTTTATVATSCEAFNYAERRYASFSNLEWHHSNDIRLTVLILAIGKMFVWFSASREIYFAISRVLNCQ